MKKAWMNTRLPLIEHFKKTKNKNMKDREYDSQWSQLEDQEKILKKDFKLEGYN